MMTTDMATTAKTAMVVKSRAVASVVSSGIRMAAARQPAKTTQGRARIERTFR